MPAWLFETPVKEVRRDGSVSVRTYRDISLNKMKVGLVVNGWLL